MEFKKAVRLQRKLKLALNGPSGSGKTYSALELATGLASGGKVSLVDTEQASASLYADKFDFDCISTADTSVKTYIALMNKAAKEGYEVVVIDSLSHAWEFLLQEHENQQARNPRENSFTAWKHITPIYNQLIRAIVACPIHVICTMRAKSEYIIEQQEGSSGKTRSVPKKIGLAPIFRQGGEYEFDVVANIDLEHRFIVEKSRIDWLADVVLSKPDKTLGLKIREWLDGGAASPKEPPALPHFVDECIKQGRYSDLIDHIITTECLMEGKTIGEVWNEHQEWVFKVFASENIKSKINPHDLKALQYFKVFLDNTQPQGEIGE